MFKKVIGLEIHAQINTETKLFSRAKINEDAEPNSCVDFLDAGMPGALPILNKEAVDLALKTCLALNLEINNISIFDRKHYFYQDSPIGYQITQLFKPIGINGFINLKNKKIRINRLHIETDAGKSIYENGKTLIDLNRCGVPLMEIVTEPDFESASEVVEFLKELKAILLTIKTSKCDMEKGNFRCDVNISLHKENEPYGTRVEIKNLNSFKFISKAIEVESALQEQTLLEKKEVEQCTKLFDPKISQVKTMRSKENALDYRYFPDPDLLPLKIEQDQIDHTKANLEKLPEQIRKELAEIEISEDHCYLISQNPEIYSFFNEIAELLKFNFTKSIAKSIANFTITELFGKLSKLNINFENFIQERKNFGKEFAKIIELVETKKISRIHSKELLDLLIEKDLNAEQTANEMGFLVEINNADVENIINQTIQKYSNEVEKYKNGKDSLLMFFVGNVLKETKGSADPTYVKEVMLQKLSKID